MLSCENLEVKRDKGYAQHQIQAGFGHLMATPDEPQNIRAIGSILQ